MAAAAWRDYLSLTKPRLSGLVLTTTAGGLWLSGIAASWQVWLATLLGTAGIVGAANAFNCVIERDFDRLMTRTAQRPLPQGRMAAGQATTFAIALALVSIPLLVWGANPLTGALGVLALVTYVLAYTPLKRHSSLAMHVGAIAGALPPLLGATAAAGEVTQRGLVLAAILYLWQLPHSLAIAVGRINEYRQAGFTSVPIQRGIEVARWHALFYVVALFGVSVLPVTIHMAGSAYLALATLLAAYLVWRTLHRRADWARQLFLATLWYLPLLFAGLALSAATAPMS